MLACTGFGNDPGLAHVICEQRLPHRVVDLVRPGVVEVFTLEQDTGATRDFCEPAGVINRRRPADVMGQVGIQAGHELVILAPAVIGLFQFFVGVDKRFRHVGASIGAKMPLLIRFKSWFTGELYFSTHVLPR